MSGQRLFISHASEDAAVAEKIVAYLEERGVPCWIASRDIPPQSIYAEEITQGIEECRSCVVIVSQAANNSAAVKRELELTSHLGKPFIPIRIDNTEPGRGLAYYLRNTQWIDYGRERERALDRIVAHMTCAPRPAAARTEAPPGSPAPSPSYQPAAEERPISDKVSPFVWVFGVIAAIAVIGGYMFFPSIMSRPGEIYEPAVSETSPEAVARGAIEAPAAPSAQEVAAADRAAREAALPQTEWMRRLRNEPIVPGEGLAGYRLGQDWAEARALHGSPTVERYDGLDFNYGQFRLGVVGTARSTSALNLVQYMSVSDPDLLLSGLMVGINGVGIGSTKREVIRAMGTPMDEELGNDEGCLHYDGVSLQYNARNRIDTIWLHHRGSGFGCYG